MEEGIGNLIIEHMNGLRPDVQSLRSEMYAELRDVKHRLASVETVVVAVKHEFAVFVATA